MTKTCRKAGVALGMALKAETLGEEGMIVTNIILFSVLIYELVGPFLTKIALTKAGEIKPDGAVSARKPDTIQPELKKNQVK